ncbi:MAG: DsbA family protein [Oleiphilaceae bacterium]|nr:DsbA family protein [Oleiphilaceae bacterium]
MGEANRRKKTGAPARPPKTPKSGRGPMIAIIVVVLLAILVGLYFLTRAPTPDSAGLPSVPPSTEAFPAGVDRYGVSIGDEDAPVVVREFADYQCPACARFAPASERLRDEYVESGQVRFVFFDLPLRQHQHAMEAAEAARCAGDQDAYWTMHDHLFDNQSEWSNNSQATGVFTRYADELGLKERRFRNCLATDLHREAVERSLKVAQQLRVASTPTVFVDNIPLSQPGWGQMSAVIERELAEAGN